MRLPSRQCIAFTKPVLGTLKIVVATSVATTVAPVTNGPRPCNLLRASYSKRYGNQRLDSHGLC